MLDQCGRAVTLDFRQSGTFAWIRIGTAPRDWWRKTRLWVFWLSALESGTSGQGRGGVDGGATERSTCCGGARSGTDAEQVCRC
jgi:hypothetical protein